MQNVYNNVNNKSIFIIDSENYNNCSNHLYGFAFVNNVAYVNCDVPMGIKITNQLPGAYIAIICDDTEISVVQDSLSTFYLFVFRQNNYFCLSNSFYALCEHVSKNHTLTLNKTFCYQYFSTPMAPLSIKSTIANEIAIVPLFSKIKINKNTGALSIIEEKKHFGDIDIDSNEGMKLFENWLNKWKSFIKAVANQKHFPLRIDLSGGYDSRTIFSLAYGAGVNLNEDNINIHSYILKTKGQKLHYGDDYEIATKISEILGFSLNNHEDIFKGTIVSGKYSYEVFKNSLLGFHKEGYFESRVHDLSFHLGGFNGEPVRGKVRSLATWLKMLKNPYGVHPFVYRELLSDFEGERNRSASEYEALQRFYLGTWGRNHYGQMVFRDFLIGKISLCPFSDLDLFRLRFPDDIDKDAIFALIIQCTCPELMTIPFANNSDFSLKTKEYVKYLCDKYHGYNDNNDVDKVYEVDFSMFEQLDAYSNYLDIGTDKDGNSYLYRFFTNPFGKKLFFEEFGSYGEKIYDYAEKYYHNKELFNWNQWCVAVVAIIEFLLIINRSGYLNTKLFLKKEQKKHLTDLPCLSNIIKDLEVYDTARFDIKNYGNEFNKVVILENTDEEAIVEKPKWFSNDIGEGVVVHSVCKKIKMTLQCIRSGQLKIFLRGKDVRNKDNERIPVDILYTKLLINNIPVFTKGQYIWYDQPFVYSKTVTDGELVEIETEWTNVNELVLAPGIFSH